jgi:UDP-glucuronate decarboxylase
MRYGPIVEEVELCLTSVNHEFFRNKKIVLAGSSGLIGTYLLAYFFLLNKQNYNVQVLSISRSKLSPQLNELIRDGGMNHLAIDLADVGQYDGLPSADIIIHAAGHAQPSMFMSNPAATLTINVAATLQLLEALKNDGTFIFLSSSEVYCGNLDQRCREDQCGSSTPYHPRASYIEGKRAGEAACAAYYAKGVRSISIRLGDIYGPGTRKYDQRALNSFIEQAVTKGEIALRDQGAAKRTYCYISDAVESILKILTSGKEQVYNLGGPVFISIRELALLIGKLTQVPVKFPDVDNEIAGAPAALNLDMHRLNSEFGYKHYTSLENGLRKTINWQIEMYAEGAIAEGAINDK